ncbi:MAG TPA: BlaI/MecI/CopY family transcriptional regulator [Phenylobacterium sp.]|nr:BlaI/MecI/CopY family transcriptional regulator [Phenylobacterium sp.]
MATSDRGRSKAVLTPLELEIMQVLWDAGPGTVGDVQGRLPSELAYTTVQTMLNVLLRKKKVRRVQLGRAFQYQPAVTREGATGAALDDLVARMFGGSAQALLMALVDARKVTPEDIQRASDLLTSRKAERK